MKNKHILLAVLIGLTSLSFSSLKAQDTITSNFSIGADIYSNYIWRGTKFGTGPAFQPSVKFTKSIFTVGVWGSYDAAGYVETDPYIYLSLPAGFSLGLTDYYYGGDLSNFSDTAGSHTLELNLGFTKGGLSLSGNYIINETGLANAGSKGGDLYFQLGYSFKTFNAFIGAGDGWHTKDSEKFAICCIGIGTSKTIKITETFSIPVTGQVVVNPDKEKLFLVLGFTL